MIIYFSSIQLLLVISWSCMYYYQSRHSNRQNCHRNRYLISSALNCWRSSILRSIEILSAVDLALFQIYNKKKEIITTRSGGLLQKNICYAYMLWDATRAGNRAVSFGNSAGWKEHRWKGGWTPDGSNLGEELNYVSAELA